MFFLSDELSNKNYEHKLNVEYFNVEPSFKLLIICIFWIQLYISLSLAIFKFRMFYEMFRRMFPGISMKKDFILQLHQGRWSTSIEDVSVSRTQVEVS